MAVISSPLNDRFHARYSSTPKSLPKPAAQLTHTRVGPMKPPVASPVVRPFTTASAASVPCNAAEDGSALHTTTQFVGSSPGRRVGAHDGVGSTSDDVAAPATALTVGATQFPAYTTPAMGAAVAEGVTGECP